MWLGHLSHAFTRIAGILPAGEGRGMAKKAVPAYDAGEKETVDRLAKLFEAAKFEIQREISVTAHAGTWFSPARNWADTGSLSSSLH